MNSTRIALSILAVCLAVAACGSDGTDGGDPAASAATATDLAGSEWIVDSFSVDGAEFPLVPDANPTVAFLPDGSEVSGTTGCNSYFASVSLGSGGGITIGGVGQTEMACFPDEVMEQERQFTAALGEVDRYEVDGDRLTLSNNDAGVVIAAIDRAAVVRTVQLDEGEWIADTRLEGDTAATLLAGTDVTLRFDSGSGRVSGSGGCNTFAAEFVVDDDRIRIDGLESTERGCDAPVMEQEQFVYGVLNDAATFEIVETRLTIMTDDGRGLGFVAADPAQ